MTAKFIIKLVRQLPLRYPEDTRSLDCVRRFASLSDALRSG
jgi:hypothetical protein